MTDHHDFDFIAGRWKVAHRRLEKRLTGCTEWIHFESDYEGTILFDGTANHDHVWGEMNGTAFEGFSLRTYDASQDEWTIYWMDNGHPNLTEQVRGSFNGEVGIFFGDDVHEGKAVRLRFIWKKLDDGLARWEQAFQVPGTNVWETNWTMDFTRLSN